MSSVWLLLIVLSWTVVLVKVESSIPWPWPMVPLKYTELYSIVSPLASPTSIPSEEAYWMRLDATSVLLDRSSLMPPWRCVDRRG